MRESMPALAGLRVLDLSEGVSGPYCTKLLAGLGAEVIKVEPPGGEPGRRAGPFPDDLPHAERSGRFLHLNTGKLGITLNVATVTGRTLLDALLPETDLLVLDGPLRRLHERDLDPAPMLARHHNLVVTAISPFGLTGPYQEFAGGEIVLFAVGGYMVLTGDPDRPPLKAYGNQVEYQAGLQAAVGSLVAIRARAAAGAGSVVDVAA